VFVLFLSCPVLIFVLPCFYLVISCLVLSRLASSWSCLDLVLVLSWSCLIFVLSCRVVSRRVLFCLCCLGTRLTLARKYWALNTCAGGVRTRTHVQTKRTCVISFSSPTPHSHLSFLLPELHFWSTGQLRWRRYGWRLSNLAALV
jgi:hypothetical protein